MGRWQQYWFPGGGRASALAARLAVAASTWLTLAHLRDAPLVAQPERAVAAAYHPVGILLLTFGHAPAAALVPLALSIASVATVALALGMYTRVAAAVALLTTWFVACWAVSFQPTWGHDNTVPLLALIALQGTRAGDVVGVDGWWRRRRGHAPLPANCFAWTPRLIALFAALAFLSAGVFKLGAGHFTLRWALSDNLRHQILAQFDLNHVARTPVADWLVQSPWRYRTAALLNMVNQFAPILACVFVRARWRSLVAVAFAAEVIGIGLVMGLWEYPWLPLAAVFVDWDRGLAWLRNRRVVPAATVPASAPVPMRWASRFIAAVVAYDIVVAFTYPRIDQRLRTYPFTAFPMFAIIRARPPYLDHQDYAFVHGRYRVQSDDRSSAAVIEDWLHRDFIYRRLFRERDPAVVRTRLAELLADIPRRFPGVAVTGVELWATIYRVPAHPAPPHLEPHDVALMGALTRDGTWTSAMSPLSRSGHEFRLATSASGIAPTTPLAAYVDGDLTPRPLVVVPDGDGVRFTLPSADVVLVTATDGPRALLIARWSRRAWW